MPPKGLAGRPPSSHIHTFFERDHTSAPTNPLYRCKACNEEVRGKDPSKLFTHSSSCLCLDEKDKEAVHLAFTEYQTKKEAQKLAAAEAAESSGSGASSAGKKRRVSGPLDRHVDTKVKCFQSYHRACLQTGELSSISDRRDLFAAGYNQRPAGCNQQGAHDPRRVLWHLIQCHQQSTLHNLLATAEAQLFSSRLCLT